MDINSKLKMNNGYEIPMLGLGTYLSKRGSEAYNAVRHALDIGYIHIDTAAIYGNEEDVGKAVIDSKIDRAKIFITTKVWNDDQGYNSTLKAFEKSLIRLNTDYIDLYLIHWPQSGTRKDTWKALEKIYSSGKVKSIGVSNYTISHLRELISDCEIIPAVNQVEFSPFLYQMDLLEYCSKHNIIIEAYSPLTRGKKLSNYRLVEIAARYSKSPVQIAIRWCLQHNLIVLPKSSNKDRILENCSIYDFELTKSDMGILNTLNENFRIAWDPTNIK